MSGERIVLRAHHGMCLAYFIGEGYSGGFTAHMGRVLAALKPDTPVWLAASVDAVCAACPNNAGGVCVSGGKAAGYDREVLERFLSHARGSGFAVRDLSFSPVRGPEGNIEYLGWLEKGGTGKTTFDLDSLVEESHGALERRE